MNISMKSRYAVRALTELARARSPTRASRCAWARSPASREMPLQFLEQVFAALRRAGVVRSRRGAAGGYSLARPAAEITVLEVVAALDGVPSPAECTQGLCDRADGCGASSVWIEAQEALERVLGGTTIGDLLAREDALRERRAHVPHLRRRTPARRGRRREETAWKGQPASPNSSGARRCCASTASRTRPGQRCSASSSRSTPAAASRTASAWR